MGACRARELLPEAAARQPELDVLAVLHTITPHWTSEVYGWLREVEPRRGQPSPSDPSRIIRSSVEYQEVLALAVASDVPNLSRVSVRTSGALDEGRSKRQ